jgi:hypothetical protein
MINSIGKGGPRTTPAGRARAPASSCPLWLPCRGARAGRYSPIFVIPLGRLPEGVARL